MRGLTLEKIAISLKTILNSGENMNQAKDKLEIIFEMQESLNNYISESRGLNFSKDEWIQKRALALIEEVTEVLNELNYKWWKNPKQRNDDKLKEELVDVLHFFVGMCIDAGMTAEEMYQIYLKKNKENFDRQNGLSSKKGYSLDEK